METQQDVYMPFMLSDQRAPLPPTSTSRSGLAQRTPIVGGMRPHALAQHLLQCDRAAVLLEQIAKRFVREFLDARHPIPRQPIEGRERLAIEADAPAHQCFFLWHQPAFLARFLLGASSAWRLPALGVLALPPLSSMLRRNASMRLTTFAGRAAGFSFGGGRPACLERMSSIIAFS